MICVRREMSQDPERLAGFDREVADDLVSDQSLAAYARNGAMIPL